MQEKLLMQNYVSARQKVEEIEATLKTAKDIMNTAESELITFMEDNDIKATANYQELGRVSLTSPELRCSILEEKRDEAFQYLRDIGEESAIKETVHWRRLNAIMKEKLESNNPMPEFINYYFQKQIRFTKS